MIAPHFAHVCRARSNVRYDDAHNQSPEPVESYANFAVHAVQTEASLIFRSKAG